MNSTSLRLNIWDENISPAVIAGCKDLNMLSQKASDQFVGYFPAAGAVRVAVRIHRRVSDGERGGCLGVRL